MRKWLMMALLTIVSMAGMAQERLITGALYDRDTEEPMIQTTVQLLRPDSTFVTGAVSDDYGVFHMTAPENGKYLLKISSVGYQTQIKRIEIVEDKNLAMGNIIMGADAIMLKGATITAQAAKVTVKEDTFVYNSSAYRTPEGSTIEELVKRLPGAEISDDGKITINGKEVKKILVDGKEFMTGDTQTALKNLPTSIIDKIKAYDEKSDLARVTGIDDGEEQTVLDFGVKPGMNKGFFGNADAAVGTKDRYSAKLMGAYFKNDTRVFFLGNANNLGDRGFPGGGGRGFSFGANNGLNAPKMLGTNFNYEQKGKLKVNGSVRWNHNDGDVLAKSSTENFVSGRSSSFGNSLSQTFSRSDSWNARARIEWTPDSMTNILFRPSFTYSASDSRKTGKSAQFSDDPYKYVTDPLSAAAIEQLDEEGVVVNSRNSSNIDYSKNTSMNGMLQVNRKLNSSGRNVTLRVDGNWGDSDSKSLSTTNVHLYQTLDMLGNDSTYQTNRYHVTPTKNWSYALQATYSEPLFRGAFLQFSYKYQYKYSKSDRSTYDFSNLGEMFFADIAPQYRNWGAYLSRLGQPIENYLDDDQSRFSEYKNYIHEIQTTFRLTRPKYQLNAGVMFQPQKSDFIQDYQGVHTDTTRTVFNWSPTFEFRYRFSKVSQLRINYRGTTAQPSMTDLLDITDNSDPLNIRMGNPGLKPSFTNNFRLFYNNFVQEHLRSVMTFLNYSNTRNSVSSMVYYDEKTGGRTTKPENINGNWDINGGLMFNTAVDSAGYWNINTFTRAGYNNYVGYLALERNSNAQKNTTRSTSFGERLSGSYRNDWLEFELDGSVNYTHTRNLLQSSNNMDTWQFGYGATVNITCPWGTTISTDLHENSRRGYSDNAMNTNELVWNAQLSQGFLKGKPLTLMLQFYDILHNQSNYSRSITAMQRSDTEYNTIHSYVMLHAVYRFNLIGGKAARQKMEEGRRPDFGRPEFRTRGGMGGGFPSGHPGGRPF